MTIVCARPRNPGQATYKLLLSNNPLMGLSITGEASNPNRSDNVSKNMLRVRTSLKNSAVPQHITKCNGKNQNAKYMGKIGRKIVRNTRAGRKMVRCKTRGDEAIIPEERCNASNRQRHESRELQHHWKQEKKKIENRVQSGRGNKAAEHRGKSMMLRC